MRRPYQDRCRGTVAAAARAGAVVLAVGLCLATAPVTAVAADLLAVLDTGELFVSADGGATWTIRSTNALPDAVDLYAGETSNELYLMSATGSIYRSTDSGVNWTAVGAISASDAAAMVVRTNGDILVLTESGSLYESTDDGATFSAIAALTGADHVSIVEERVSSKNLYVLTASGAVSESTNGGATWTTVGVLGVPNAVEIRADQGDLYALTATGDLAESTNAGVTWTFISTTSQVGTRSLTVNNHTLVSITREGHVATTADAVNWSWPGSINQLNVVALSTDEPTVSGVDDRPPAPGGRLVLHSLFPNPVPAGGLGEVSVRFSAPQATSVSLEVYDVRGRRVATRAFVRAGTEAEHVVRWQPGNLPSGLYVVRLVGSTGSATRKFTVLK